MTFALGHKEVNAFAVANAQATLLLFTATSDYAACRCCLLNGLFPGLVLGAQAAEKSMKAMLLLANPGSNSRNYRHDLAKLADKVSSDGLVDLSSHAKTIKDLSGHYQSRYPDNPGRAQTASTSELAGIDALMLDLAAAMPMPVEVALRAGLYSRVLMSSETGKVWADEYWLLHQNPNLRSLLPDLRRKNSQWLAMRT